MKYSCEIVIDLPRDKVIELFDSTENMYKWQPELVSHEFLEGEQGQVGAKMKLSYKLGKRDMDMIETITVRNLPDEFSGTYEAPGVWNLVQNYFTEVGPHQTKWVSEQEFKMSSFMMKAFAFLMPGSFKKQSNKYLQRFKEFAESAN